MNKKLTVFVTGSTGLLGLNTINALLEKDYQVLALARDAAKASRVLPKDERVKVVIGDLENPGSWTPRLAESDVLIHGAAYFREAFTRDKSDNQLQKLNVELPVHLLREAIRLGVKRSIMISSSGVYSGRPDGKASDESSPMEGQLADSGYQQSKVAMERALAKVPLSSEHEMIIVRPGWMWGPLDYAPTNTAQLILDMKKVRTFQFVKGTPFGIVDVRDVAAGLSRLVEQPNPAAIYNLAGNNMTAFDAVSTVAELDGQIKIQAIPMGLALGMSRVLEFVTGILKKHNPIPREGLLVVTNGISIDSSLAERDLGIRFRPFRETASDSLEFVKATFLSKA